MGMQNDTATLEGSTTILSSKRAHYLSKVVKTCVYKNLNIDVRTALFATAKP